MEQSILETWQSETSTPDARTVAAMRLDTARALGVSASSAQTEARMWRPLQPGEAGAALRAQLDGREPSEAEVLAYQEGWASEGPDMVTLAGGDTWQRDASGIWTRVVP